MSLYLFFLINYFFFSLPLFLLFSSSVLFLELFFLFFSFSSFRYLLQFLNFCILYSLPSAAIVRSASECVELVSQKMGGKVLQKRDLVVFDDSNTEVRLTLWGEKGDNPIQFIYFVLTVFTFSLLSIWFSSVGGTFFCLSWGTLLLFIMTHSWRVSCSLLHNTASRMWFKHCLDYLKLSANKVRRALLNWVQ